MAALLTLVAHHKHGTITEAFEPKLTGLCENPSTGSNRVAPAFQAVTTQQNYCKSSLKFHLRKVLCGSKHDTKAVALQEDAEQSFPAGSCCAGHPLSSIAPRDRNSSPAAKYFQMLDTHRHRGVKGQGTLWFVFLKETASDPLFLCLASEDTLEQRGAGMSSMAGKGHMQ